LKYTINQHISQLLYHHECVVVPEFGAFLTRSYPAELNSSINMLRPAWRQVVFNGRIAENDGLLAKHVASVEGITYKEALEAIFIAVKNWKRLLRGGQKLNLAGVGKLFLDTESTLQFNPAQDVNYNVYSYGLPIFRASAVEREEKLRHSVNRALVKHGAQSAEGTRNHVETKGGIKRLVWQNGRQISRVAAVLGPAIAIGLVGSYLYTKQPQAVYQAAGYVQNVLITPKESANRSEERFFWEGSAERKRNEAVQINDHPKKAVKELTPPYPEAKQTGTEPSATTPLIWEPKNTSSYLQMGPRPEPASLSAVKKQRQNSAIGLEKQEDYLAEATSAAEGKSAGEEFYSAAHYQIVVGSFSQAANARRYQKELEAQGFAAYLSQGKGYTRVALGKFSQQTQARHQLSNIRQALTADAWIKGVH
jgi:cell division protein FtsN/nucleoid DNA-binding protein